MKQFLISIAVFALAAQNFAQTQLKQSSVGIQNTKQQHFIFQKQTSVNFDTISHDFQPSLMVREMPKQGAEKMEMYNYPDKSTVQQAQNKTSAILSDLALGQNYVGNPWGLSTPNDNDLAISDSGYVVSVINTNIYIRNTKTDSVSPIKSLNAFTSPINNLHQEFDPKVMYDPKMDRFVLMCMVGFVDSTSKMIIGFSQSNNPTGNWNLYVIPGNPLNNNLWSDYPMIAMTEKELFLSVNLLTNNSSWQTGFVETLVWQMKKDSGYAGLPLSSTLHSNIQYNGKAIRNLCPAKGGSQLYSPNMYFVSNRNFASQNDTVFLVNVTDVIGSPNNTVTVKAIVSSQSYYFPPGGRQSLASQTLATNDARNLGAFYENNKIQFVSNTNNPANNQVSVYYGIIDNPSAISPIASGYIIPNDTVDFGYPNISYAGNSSSDNTAIINFNHSSNKIYAGCSAIKADAAGNFSNVLRIKNGLNYINLLTSGLERWGDYSGSQRKYNNPGEVWISGYYSYSYSSSRPYAHRAYVAQLVKDESLFAGLPATNPLETPITKVYPNPAIDMFSVELNLNSPEYLSFELYNANGQLVSVLLKDWVKVKQNVFSFSTHNLSKGLYVLTVNGTSTHISKKIIVQ